jgi:hypothetical protein
MRPPRRPGLINQERPQWKAAEPNVGIAKRSAQGWVARWRQHWARRGQEQKENDHE